MEPSRPLVSIVVPCFNQSSYLPECLRSISRQSQRKWEAIVVDDGSTLGHPDEIVASLNDDRFRLIQHEINLGPGPARNTGVRAARSDIIALVDADDAIDPAYLERTLSALDHHPTAGCAYTDYRLFGAKNAIERVPDPTIGDIVNGTWISPGSIIVMRKHVWTAIGGYVEQPPLSRVGEDWDFWLGMMERGIQPVHVPLPLYCYRQHPTSTTETVASYLAAASRRAMYRRHRQLFRRYPKERARFLSDGYINSTRALVDRGEWLQAVFMGTHAVLAEPGNPRFRGALATLVGRGR